MELGFAGGPLSIDFFCCRLEMMEVDPLRLVFLLLMVAIGASVAASVGLVFSGCGGGCGCCGSEEDGSSSSFPWRRLSSVASLDPWLRELGGAAPTDACSALPSARPWRLLRFVKAFVRWVLVGLEFGDDG